MKRTDQVELVKITVPVLAEVVLVVLAIGMAIILTMARSAA